MKMNFGLSADELRDVIQNNAEMIAAARSDLERLELATSIRDAALDLVNSYVDAARAGGSSWQEVGLSLGVSVDDARDEHEFDDDLSS